MELLSKKCINLIIDDALNTDSKDFFIATLLLNGLGGVPLKEMPEEELIQEVYDRLSFLFSSEENELFAEDNESFKKWILNQPAYDWCEKGIY